MKPGLLWKSRAVAVVLYSEQEQRQIVGPHVPQVLLHLTYALDAIRQVARQEIGWHDHDRYIYARIIRFGQPGPKVNDVCEVAPAAAPRDLQLDTHSNGVAIHDESLDPIDIAAASLFFEPPASPPELVVQHLSNDHAAVHVPGREHV